MHIVGDHQAGDLLFGHDALGEVQHLFGGGRVESGGVLVQKQELRGDEGGHQQGQCLTLTARQQAHRLLHPVFEAHIQQSQLLTEDLLILAGDAGEDGVGGRPCAKVGQRQILLDGHVGGRTLERVLEQVADDPAALIFRREGDVLAAQRDAALVGDEAAGDGIEEGGFARAVGADDGGEVSRFHGQADAVQGHFLVDGAGVEGLVQVTKFEHFHFTHAPSVPDGPHCGASQRRSSPGWRASRWPQPR